MREKYPNTGFFSVPHFPVFGLNTERYSVSLRNQSEYGKIRTRKNSVFGQFLCSNILQKIFGLVILQCRYYCFYDSRDLLFFLSILTQTLRELSPKPLGSILVKGISLLFPSSILQLKLGWSTAFEKGMLSSVACHLIFQPSKFFSEL